MGPGSHLHKLIADWTGQEPTLSCGCRAWIKKMDAQPAWARSRVDLIVAKLRREARRNATSWKAVPASGERLSWRGRASRAAFLIPGMGIMLTPFLHAMVLRALALADEDAAQVAHGA
jgi:hypothetical protein